MTPACWGLIRTIRHRRHRCFHRRSVRVLAMAQESVLLAQALAMALAMALLLVLVLAQA